MIDPLMIRDSVWFTAGDHVVGVVLIEVERGADELPGWKAYIGALDYYSFEAGDALQIAQRGARFKPGEAVLALFPGRALDLERHVP